MGSTLSVLASIAILRSSIEEFVPQEIRGYLWKFSRRFSSELTIVVKESHEGLTNHLFHALVTYLGSMTSTASSNPRRLTVGKNESMKVLTFGLDRNSEVFDTFHGVSMKWGYYTEVNSTLHYELRWYELRFHKQYKDMVTNKYLPHILDMAKAIKDQNRVVKFYTTRGGRDGWSSKGITLDHPMTFSTLAMDGELKQKVIDDLDTFMRSKEYYKKIGKVWKRGYLLYGPPGTGKSSLIAAMANYLNFDIYSLNLSAVNTDSSLEYLLLHMSNRSILVVEDIDCSIVLQNRLAEDHQPEQSSVTRPQVTLSGLLNAIDGLLSCCGDERIIVFTTNYKDRIDPALLRAGRMDMHIYLSYCTFSTFKQLAANYLEIWDHELFSQVEKVIREVQISPADVAGELMKTKDPDICLEKLIGFLKNKVSEAKSAVSSSAGSEGNANGSERDGNDSLNLNDEHPVESSCEETDLDDNVPTTVKEVKSAAANCTSTKAHEYSIKAELMPILNSVLLKYGDIAANSSLHSLQFRSFFLETFCGIIQKLQEADIKSITQLELNSMLSSIRDLESVGMKVGWLRQRLDEIGLTIAPGDHRANLEANEGKFIQDTAKSNIEPTRCHTEALMLRKGDAKDPENTGQITLPSPKLLFDGLL